MGGCCFSGSRSGPSSSQDRQIVEVFSAAMQPSLKLMKLVSTEVPAGLSVAWASGDASAVGEAIQKDRLEGLAWVGRR